MGEEPAKWRVILLEASHDSWELDTRQQQFVDAIQNVAETYGLRGVEIILDRQPRRESSPDEEKPLTHLYAKVAWPLRQEKRAGLLELEDVMDDFQKDEQRLPPL